jgi:VWFA-related protein
VGLLSVVPLVAVVSPPQGETTVFHAGTRLVEVEVVVRGHQVWPHGFGNTLKAIFDSGPPFGPPGASIQGLTKDDFRLFDDGKPEQISIFRAGPRGTNELSVPPGAISNRRDGRGQPLNGATAVLIDFLNADWKMTEYSRLGMKGLLRSLTETDTKVAIYSLGTKLHGLQDFTDDPQKLIDAVAEMDQPHGRAPAGLASALQDYGDPPTAPETAPAAHGPMTVNALRLIIQHLSGMPGRKNLVWLMPAPAIPGPVREMLLRANIVLYPVVMRSGGDFETVEKLAAAFGGRAFFDAMDLPFALRAAEGDVEGSYVLGYYPAEEMLDGKYHNITVKLTNAKLAKDYEVQFRTGYSASKIAATPAPPSLSELFTDSLQATGIGLVGRATPDPQHADLYEVEVTVDLRDIHLDHKDGLFTGAFDLSLPNPSSSSSGARTVQTRTVSINLSEAELAGVLEKGGTFDFAGIGAQSGEIRVAVRDHATGVAGSLHIPVGTPAAK